ncbi:MAG: helical backbone metal receptor [Bacteroidia bacterium]|nr:helical backbone metal receptor [Bacteroidia bacterium]MDW8346903.1 helical backbone metal receptor [Bacteroidia bacterium]
MSTYPPKRIVSLVPSQTELLYELGLTEQVVGITKFCVHPHNWRKEKTLVGGTKQVHYDKIKALEPDLIIANKEENTQEIVQKCSDIAPVYVTEVQSIDDAFRMMLNIGELVDRQVAAQNLKMQVEKDFEEHKGMFSGSILYFIWQEPYMVTGADTFVNAVLSHFGLTNLACTLSGRYPTLTHDEVKSLNPQYIFLPSEPYPFKEKHAQQMQTMAPHSKILLVDGEMFSWYGSRMKYTCSYMKSILKQSLV